MDEGPSFLQQFAHTVKSRVGAAYPGRHAHFRGHDLHQELRDLGWVELFAFGITGRRFDPPVLEMLEALWVYTSYPDARLWNNRQAALGASSRSTPALSMAAALAVSEASIYGGRAGVWAYDYFVRAKAWVDGNRPLHELIEQEIAQGRRIYGFGRPIDSVDERLPFTLQLAESLGLAGGAYLALAKQTEALLVARNPILKMNYGGLAAAMYLDLGFTQREYALMTVPLFFAGMPPCYVDAAERPAGTFMPLACADIAYDGPGRRAWT